MTTILTGKTRLGKNMETLLLRAVTPTTDSSNAGAFQSFSNYTRPVKQEAPVEDEQKTPIQNDAFTLSLTAPTVVDKEPDVKSSNQDTFRYRYDNTTRSLYFDIMRNTHFIESKQYPLNNMPSFNVRQKPLVDIFA